MTRTTSQESTRSTRKLWVLVGMGLWTAVVLVALCWLLSPERANSAQAWVVHGGDSSRLTLAERARDWFRLVHLNFQRVYPWVLFGPYVIWLASRFNLERGRLPLNLVLHVCACAAFVGASYAVNSRVSTTSSRVVVVATHNDLPLGEGGGREIKTMRLEVSGSAAASVWKEQEFHTSLTTGLPPALVRTRRDLNSLLPTNLIPELESAFKPSVGRATAFTLRPLSTLLDLLAYGSLVGISHAVHFYRRFRERERRALFLESNLTRARLSALQAQLQPHFLFNTLNAIATLLRRDPRAAETTLTSLSELLRLALSQSEKQEIPLREEIRFLERYVEIQQTRFGDRLRFEQDVEPAALDCLVPTLMLQPLVENAVRHGIEPSPNPGKVRVAAWQDAQRLALTVEDDGVGLVSASRSRPQEGIGLSNLRARLEALYGADQLMELVARPEGGVVVRIEIPWRLAAENGSTGQAP